MTSVIIIVAVTIVVFLLEDKKKSMSKDSNTADNKEIPKNIFLPAWRIILTEKVVFYNGLSDDDKLKFEQKILDFFSDCRITGVSVEIDDADKLLVAASAVIPIFNFNDWRYLNLYDVLIYPTSFNHNFEITGPDRQILGMVGTGFMDGKMILSKQALHHGFANESDKQNTAIHEFVHLIDKTDGAIDGIPEILLKKQYTLPWLDLIAKKTEDIYANKSDINPYGATSKIEFFAVISEYFFERPQLLAQKHPELYELLETMFKQDMTTRKLNRATNEIGRNDLCPCNSKKKFKKCCGKVHFS